MTDLFDPAPARADHATAAARLLLPAIAGDAKITRAMLNDAMIRAYGGTDADGHWTQRESFEVLEHATALAVCAAGTTPAPGCCGSGWARQRRRRSGRPGRRTGRR